MILEKDSGKKIGLGVLMEEGKRWWWILWCRSRLW